MCPVNVLDLRTRPTNISGLGRHLPKRSEGGCEGPTSSQYIEDFELLFPPILYISGITDCGIYHLCQVTETVSINWVRYIFF